MEIRSRISSQPLEFRRPGDASVTIDIPQEVVSFHSTTLALSNSGQDPERSRWAMPTEANLDYAFGSFIGSNAVIQGDATAKFIASNEVVQGVATTTLPPGIMTADLIAAPVAATVMQFVATGFTLKNTCDKTRKFLSNTQENPPSLRDVLDTVLPTTFMSSTSITSAIALVAPGAGAMIAATTMSSMSAVGFIGMGIYKSVSHTPSTHRTFGQMEAGGDSQDMTQTSAAGASTRIVDETAGIAIEERAHL